MKRKTSARVTPERLMQFAWGYAAPLIIEAAIEHRVFDLLDGHKKTVDQLSTETGASVRGLTSIMNALTAFGFLAKDKHARYALTPESAAFLVSTKPSFHGGLYRHISGQLLPRWLKLNEIVKTGKPAGAANQEGSGAEFFQQFVEDIFFLSYPSATALGKSLKLAKAKGPVRVLDLAAGSGVWGITLAQQSRRVSVTAVDWPAVIPVTRRVADRMGVGERFRYIEGDLLEADFGAGHDVATLGHILHSEGEARSRRLLKKTAEALSPGGTIAIGEFVADDDRAGPAGSMIFAVNMLVNTDEGDTFTFAEISGWLKEAGFAKIRRLAGTAPSPLILGTKAG